MIRTTNQLTVTQKKIADLKKTIAEHENRKGEMDPMDHRIEAIGLNHLLRKMENEVEEYLRLSDESYRSGSLSFNIKEFPTILIKARLIRKMSQSDLARQIGVEPQQIQRYEASSYAGASFDRLVEIQRALGFEAFCEAQLHDRSSRIPAFNQAPMLQEEERRA